MSALWVTGDTLEVARQLPDACVDLIITSPPFLALRSYLPADDPAKAQEIGQESTPGEFLDVLLDLVVEWRRILTPHGSLCVELGDTYSGSGGAGGDYNEGGLRDGQQAFDGSAMKHRRIHDPAKGPPIQQNPHWAPRAGGPGWPLDKSLCMIPQLFAIALSYGVNPLTGRTLEPWRCRNVIRWCRPNPPVGALGDKFRPATSEMLVACTGRTRWFDLDAVRTPWAEISTASIGSGGRHSTKNHNNHYHTLPPMKDTHGGAPPLDWWEIPTHPYPGSHYATFPPALVVKPIEAMCPRQVCQTCGQPSVRITSEPTYADRNGDPPAQQWEPGIAGVPSSSRKAVDAGGMARHVETLGWTDCGHNDYRPGRVLDPFGGSGTTLAVATGHGRTGIGIDLDRRNVDLARERVGPMFFTELTAAELAEQLEPITTQKDVA